MNTNNIELNKRIIMKSYNGMSMMPMKYFNRTKRKTNDTNKNFVL